MKRFRLIWSAAILWLALCLPAAAGESGWISLFDGKSLEGWRVAGNASSFRVQDGAIVADGEPAWLFAAPAGAGFRSFESRAEVATRRGATSDILFHTEWKEGRAPEKGYEVRIHNECRAEKDARPACDPLKTGSLVGVRNVLESPARDGSWFTLWISVRGRRVQVRIDEVLTVDYVEPLEPRRGKAGAGRRLSRGTFAIRCAGQGGAVLFRNIAVRAMDEDADTTNAAVAASDAGERNVLLLEEGFPLADFHVHLKGGLTIQEALAHSRKLGIQYGVSVNCGLGFGVTNDAELLKALSSLEGQPVFRGMQAEGREWVQLFSAEAVARFDYVFTDAMTFTDQRGKRVRLWIPGEVEVGDPEVFMEMYLDRIVGILQAEPIDIFVNPTVLPDVIRDKYDTLWTEERMDRVIRAAVKSGIAIEINSRLRLPSARFIRRAKAAGAKFSLGTNNGDRDLGDLEYSIAMVRECGIEAKDMFLPKPPGAKPVELRGLERRP